MVKIVKAPVIKRGNVFTVSQNIGKTPETKRVPRPQPVKKKNFR